MKNSKVMFSLASSSFLILSTIILLFCSTQTIRAQTAQIFKSYEDPILGVSIQYPSDWIITTEKNHIRFNPHQSYKRYHQWTTEKSRPIVIFETSWHAPYIPQLSMRNVIRPFFMTRFSSI